jgi:hypothetical protein
MKKLHIITGIAVVAGAIAGVYIGSLTHGVTAATQTGGHTPYTTQPVTPGDPSSYVNTVGQCPFYENAGAKGCVVPPNLTCNADWTVCTPNDSVNPQPASTTPIQGSTPVLQPTVTPQPAKTGCVQ